MGSLSESISLFCIILSIVSIYGTETPNITENIKLRSGKENYRIIGGFPADEKKWPFIAAITIGKLFVCGGSLLRENWVLTAAHCVTGQTIKTLIHRGNTVGAAIGAVEIIYDYKYLVSADVDGDMFDLLPMIKDSIPCSYYKVHPEYELTISNGLSIAINDIALLKLSRYLIFSEVVPLASKLVSDGMICTTAGWGARHLKPKQDEIARYDFIKLYNIMLEILPRKICYGIFCSAFSTGGLLQLLTSGQTQSKVTKLLTDKICTHASGHDNYGGVGRGDSGGPLICDGELQGITSIQAATPGGFDYKIYGLFTETNKFTTWINAILVDDGEDPLPRSVPTAKGTKLVLLNNYCIPLFFVVHLICLRI